MEYIHGYVKLHVVRNTYNRTDFTGLVIFILVKWVQMKKYSSAMNVQSQAVLVSPNLFIYS